MSTFRLNQLRLDRMRQAMEAAHLDALVLRLPENVLLLSGYWPMLGASTLVFPLDGRPQILVPEYYAAEASASLWDADARWFRFGVLGARDPMVEMSGFLADVSGGKGWKRIGYEANFQMMAPAWQTSEILIPSENTRAAYAASLAGCELVDASAVIQHERRRKTSYEAEKLRITSEISCIGMEAFQKMVGVGVSGIELVAAVEAEIMARGIGYKGAQRVRGYAQVATGPDESSIAFRMNEISTTRRLKHGDVALLELGVVADGFWADRTRVRVAGQPTDEQARVFEVLVAAQEAGCAALKPGVTGAYVDEVGRAIIRDAGLESKFPHITGHGLGFGYHEASPKLAPGSADVMEEGFFVSVEPGIYYQPVGGFRLEDDVLITADGAEVLGPFTKEL